MIELKNSPSFGSVVEPTVVSLVSLRAASPRRLVPPQGSTSLLARATRLRSGSGSGS
jgi:hypothetical protein